MSPGLRVCSAVQCSNFGYMLAAALVLCILCYTPTVGTVQFYRYCYSTAVTKCCPGVRCRYYRDPSGRPTGQPPGFSRRQIEDIKNCPYSPTQPILPIRRQAVLHRDRSFRSRRRSVGAAAAKLQSRSAQSFGFALTWGTVALREPGHDPRLEIGCDPNGGRSG